MPLYVCAYAVHRAPGQVEIDLALLGPEDAADVPLPAEGGVTCCPAELARWLHRALPADGRGGVWLTPEAAECLLGELAHQTQVLERLRLALAPLRAELWPGALDEDAPF